MTNEIKSDNKIEKSEEVYESVKSYYGKELQRSEDLKTNACTSCTAPPPSIKSILSHQIHPEVLAKYYGCGLIFPPVIWGARVLDIGCGSGRDCFVLSKLVGPSGRVVGVDMTQEQISVAERHVDYHTRQFGYAEPNVRFVRGYMERLDEVLLLGDEEKFDVIVSNCVVNLSPNKEQVLRQVFNLLKPGGEFYFSDVYSTRPVPKALVDDPVLFGECLSGALSQQEFMDIAVRVGFKDPRMFEMSPITIQNREIEEKFVADDIRFNSITFRLFKIDNLDEGQQDYGQSVIFNGPSSTESVQTVDSVDADLKKVFKLDQSPGGSFEVGKSTSVSGNTWKILSQSRFKHLFSFNGDFTTHYGRFEPPECCSSDSVSKSTSSCSQAKCC